MQKNYQEALTAFGIQSGFVDEQVEGIYQSLMAQYNPDIFEFLSPENCDMSDKKYQLTMAYYLLCQPFPHYIVNQNSRTIKEEQMIDEILRLIYNYSKNHQEIDKRFIAQLVELLVSYKNLHNYVRDIEFHSYSKDSVAEYTNARTLKVYETNFKEAFDSYRLEKDEKFYYSVSLVRHEIEHVDQKRKRESSEENTQVFLWKACSAYVAKEDAFFDTIVKLPNPFFFILKIIASIISHKNDRKYQKNWLYCPEERVADICGNDLALTLIEHAQNKEDLERIRNILNDEIMEILFFGYTKPLGPTDFYLSRFKQYSDCLQLMELAKSLTLEERLFLGLQVSNEELESAKINKEKILSGVRKLC